jgi:hypothetical protein
MDTLHKGGVVVVVVVVDDGDDDDDDDDNNNNAKVQTFFLSPDETMQKVHCHLSLYSNSVVRSTASRMAISILPPAL